MFIQLHYRNGEEMQTGTDLQIQKKNKKQKNKKNKQITQNVLLNSGALNTYVNNIGMYIHVYNL
jgi:hypothetical protein